MKIAFVCDSGTGRNVSQLKEMGIFSCPLQISSESANYLELEDITIEEVYDKVAQQEMLKTSLPPLGMINETVEEIKSLGYDTVFCVPICSGLSSAHNAFRLACEDVGLDFIFVDTYVTAEVEFYCITTAKKMYENGKSLDEIMKVMNEIVESAHTLLIPMDLDHLARGGRLTPFAATLAGLLKIHPILRIDKTTEGRIDVVDKVRTLTKAMDKAIEFMKESKIDDSYEVFVAYVKETKNCEMMVEKIQHAFPSNTVQLIPLISTVGCHTGIGCICLQYYKKIELS